MNTAAIRKLRKKLKANDPVYGLWITLESATITEMAVALGLDWVVIDAEHGHLDWHDILEHLRATVRSDTTALIRVTELNLGQIKRALDIGADGVVIPWVETAEQLRQAVSFCTYPPRGVRGIGGERATGWGRCLVEHTAEADEHVLVVPIIETVRAGKNIEELCRVDGVDLFQFGPADYSSTAGYKGQWEGPGVADQLLSIKDSIRKAGKHCGVLPTSNENLIQRREQGFQFLGLGMDAGLLLRSVTGALTAVGRETAIFTSFSPNPSPEQQPAPKTESAPYMGSVANPLPGRPPGFEPNRPEVVTTRNAAKRVELERGVVFQPLVGAHNQAQHLTTGIVTFMPGAQLPYHTHPHGEAITLLTGEAELEVAGRRYRLFPLDNVYIPPGTAHAAFNPSGSKPATFHIAMNSHTPSRTLVAAPGATRKMADDAGGVPGAERVSRHATTPWYEPNPGAKFQDYFNRDLGSIGMSGGYGIFQHGGRLPCHLHDFDESITIIQGTATCIVEGRRYLLSDCATALAPRGRCHYFINDTERPMAMIWVYAGDLPQRYVLNQKCCEPEGCPEK
ncbi:MAG: cupin domain-containing protein [Planctomycetes bacterium]|nr:cupin domain-containing protein [Planctomycetota bacterium]